MNPKIDTYLLEGCGRCPHYRSPKCKVHLWPEELKQLRRIVLETGLEEEYKWSQPCYTFGGNNILIVSALKEYATLAFFKGSLLKDDKSLLVAPGVSSQASRQFRFTNVKDILNLEATIKAYIFEAIEVERAGLKVEFKQNPEPIPDELQQKLDEDAFFKNAFDALTPGRQRGYILYFSQPKQSKTRVARIERYVSKILNGEGMHDKYKKTTKSQSQ